MQTSKETKAAKQNKQTRTHTHKKKQQTSYAYPRKKATQEGIDVSHIETFSFIQ